jgi:hypothetical protein
MNASYAYNIDDNEGSAAFTVEDGIVTTISVRPSKGSYTIDRLFEEYGQPPEVYIETFQDAPEGNPPFIIMINYPNLNTVALYEGIADRINDDQLRGCFDKIEPKLIFAARLKTLPFKEMADLLLGSNPPVYPKRIDEATDMNPGDFYQYAISTEQICIDTPSDLWP